MLYVLFSFEEEGYDFQVEIASEDFNKIKEKALAIGGLDLSELKPDLNDVRGFGTNYDIKGWVDLGIKDSRQYIVQGKEIELPEDKKILGIFFNGNSINWEGELLALGNKDQVWSAYRDHLDYCMEETMDFIREMSLAFKDGEPLVDTSDNEYFLKEIEVI